MQTLRLMPNALGTLRLCTGCRRSRWLSDVGRRGVTDSWVTADERGRVPALLLEWRQTPDGWQGRVVRPVLDAEDERWRPREEWLPADALAPA